MTAKEMFRKLGYEVTYENKEILEYSKDGSCIVMAIAKNREGVIFFDKTADFFIPVTREKIEAIHKALTENETSFDLDEAVARATLGNPKFKKHE